MYLTLKQKRKFAFIDNRFFSFFFFLLFIFSLGEGGGRLIEGRGAYSRWGRLFTKFFLMGGAYSRGRLFERGR